MKNLLLFAAMLLTSAVSMAQLYVAPNGSTDSYVYVNDQVLYVTQDINLVENNSGTTEASIYLRNQSQLIQGGTTSTNTGDGYISVYQNTPDDDSWDYTFWSSPVGLPTGTGNQNFGIARVNQAMSLTDAQTAAVTTNLNGIENPLTISRRWLYKRPGGSGYQAIHLTNSVPAGLGFTMKGVGTTNHDQNYDFRGRPHSGNIDVAVVAGTSVLSGNPYPSALDLNRLFYDAANTEITEFRYWDENRNINSHNYSQNQGGYGIWVPGPSDPNGTNAGLYTVAPFLHYDSSGGTTGGQTGTGASYDRRFAPIGQGFNIYSATNSGTITIRNSHRRYIQEGTTSDFRGMEGGDTESDQGAAFVEDTRLPQLRINAYMNRTHMRQLVLAFYDQATAGYDRGLDGRSPMDASSEAYFPIGEGDEMDKFVINTRPFENGTVQVPVNFELSVETNLTFKAVEEVNMDRDAYLLDNTTGSMKKITSDAHAAYLLPAGNYENRFFIVFRNNGNDDSTTLVDSADQDSRGVEEGKVNVDFFQNNAVAQLEVRNPEGYDIESAYIFDMTGKLVVSRKNIGSEKNFTFSTASLSDGVYLVKLTTSDNIDIDYKITIKN